MALAVANSVSYFGNNFRIEPTSNAVCKLVPSPLELSGVSIRVLTKYQACGKMHKKMRKKEAVQHCKRSSLLFRSHSDVGYQAVRSGLVDWISQVGQQCGLHSLTVHTAIAYVDKLVDVLPVDPSRFYLVAAATIMIAAKMEEMEERLPRVGLLDQLVGNRVPGLLPRFETLILNCLQWEMVLLTPSHFLGYYLEACLVPEEVGGGANPHLQNYEKTKTYLVNMAEFLLDLTEHYSVFREFLPSVVAAGAIGAARIMLKVAPYWSPSLQLLTTHPTASVDPCIMLINRYYQQSFTVIA